MTHSPHQTRVAVVMTTFEGARWVAEQARSIAAQTRPVDVVRVADDGSTDSTLELLRRELPVADVTVNAQRLGTVRSLDSALSTVDADVVLLADQDDRWHPDRVARLVGTQGLTFHDARLVDSAGGVLRGTLWDHVGLTPSRRRRLATDPLGVLLEGNPVTGATVAVHRDVLTLGLPLPQQGWHDYWLALVAAAHDLPVVAVAEPLIDYRVHGANTAGLPPRGLRARLRAGPAARRQRESLVAMLGELLERLPAGPAAARVLSARDHLCRRLSLPRSRWRRLPGAGRLLLSGSYAAHGGGWRTAVVDILERYRG